jgi:hypothetical protein
MKRNTKLATILAAGTAAAVGGVLAAGPVAAAVSGNGRSPTSSTTGSYSRMMGGNGGGNTTSRSGGSSMMGSSGSGYSGMMGSGITGTGMMGSGANGMMGANGVGMMGSIAVTAPSGTLNTAQRAALAGIAEQQQLARDLYQALAAQYDSAVLDHVATATAYRLDAIRTLMTRYGVTDPTTGTVAGTFSDPAVQTTYNRLLAQGQSSYDNALAAVRTVEAAQVTALTNDLSGLTAPDVRQVYNRLVSLAEMYQGMFALSAN